MMTVPRVLHQVRRNLLADVLMPRQFPVSRPRLLRELVLIEDEQGLIVDGGHKLQVLKGKSVRSILPRLLPLLDGKRSMEEVEAMLPAFPAEHVREAVKVLLNASMIEDCATPAPVLNGNLDSLEFFRRHLGATRRNRSGDKVSEKLQDSEVLICACDTAEADAEVLASLFATMGVGRVTTNCGNPRDWSVSSPQSQRRRILVALALEGENREWNSALDEFAAELHIPWLRVAVEYSSGRADLGPIFKRGQNGCYKCFATVQLAQSWPARAIAGVDQADRLFWAGMAATEIVYWLSDIAPVALKREFYRYNLNDWTCSELRWARVPGCSSCYPNTGEPALRTDRETFSAIRTAAVFEEYIALQTLAPSENEVDKPMRKAASSVRQPKRFSHCLQVGLSRELPKLDTATLDVLQHRNQAARATLSRGSLGALLTATAGVREPHSDTSQVKRWAATGGNLGSVELYVAVRNVDGLPPGIYFYQSGEQNLARFQRRGDALAMEEFINRVSPGAAPDVDALVLFTGAFSRISRKYGSFAYKLANLDAGVALSQLRLVASTLGISSRTACRWADDLIEHQLNLDSVQEFVTAVVELSSSPNLNSRTPGLPQFSAPDHLASDFQERSLAEVTRCLIGESRMREQDLVYALTRRASVHIPNGKGTQVLALPAVGRGGRLVTEVLGRRSSMRRFSVEPITVQQVSTMLAAARDGDREDWPEEHALGELGFVVLAHRVQGLAPGVYRYDGIAHGLEVAGQALTQEINQQLFTQPEFASAPAVLWITGNLKQVCDRLGSFGHRQLLLRAGAAGNRAWFAGIALGISGCLIGGVIQSAAREFLGFDGFAEVSLLALATGYAQQSIK